MEGKAEVRECRVRLVCDVGRDKLSCLRKKEIWWVRVKLVSGRGTEKRDGRSPLPATSLGLFFSPDGCEYDALVTLTFFLLHEHAKLVVLLFPSWPLH